MKNKKRIATILMIIFLFTLLSPIKYARADATRESKDVNLLEIGKKIEDSMKDGDKVKSYQFILNNAGRTKIQFNTEIYLVSFEVINSKGDRIHYDEYAYGGSNDNPKYKEYTLDLEPDTYKIKIYKDRHFGYTGRFDLKVDFKAANNNDIEPNNGLSTAQKLNFNNKVTGFISETDNIDIYEINVPKTGKLSVDINTEISYSYLELVDNKNETIYNESISGGGEGSPKYEYYQTYLEPGKYYLKVKKYEWWNPTGKYNLTLSFKDSNSNEVEPNNSQELAQELMWNIETRGVITTKDNVDRYKVIVDKKCKIKVEVKSELSHVNFSFFNERNEKIVQDTIRDGSEGTFIYKNYEVDVNQGVYYLEFEKYEWYNPTGIYSVKINSGSSDWEYSWATREIQEAMKLGWINKSDKFRPEDQITRAEFIKIVNKSFGFTKKSSSEKFVDVIPEQWWYDEVLIALQAGYIDPNQAKFRPEDKITREEVAAIVTSIKKNKDSNLDKIRKFKDYNKVSPWAKSSVEGAVEAGYMGKGSLEFRPTSNITRAEAVVTLYRIVK